MADEHDGLQEIIDEALRDMAAETACEPGPQTRNLADFCRRTGLSRQRARTSWARTTATAPWALRGHDGDVRQGSGGCE